MQTQNIMISGSLGPKVVASENLANLKAISVQDAYSGDPKYLPASKVRLELRIGANLESMAVRQDFTNLAMKQFVPNYELEEATLDLSQTYFQEQEDGKRLREEKVKAKDEEEKKKIEERQSKLAEEEAEKRAKQERQRQKWEEENREKEAKINEMMTICGSHLTEADTKFYLESQNWDIRQAIRFYYEYSGTQVQSKAEIKLIYPDDRAMVKELKNDDTLWDVRIAAASNLPPNAQFEISISKGEPFEPESYGKSLLELGFVPSATIYVELQDGTPK